MNDYNLTNNNFLRQFEVEIDGQLARIEYAEQEERFFLTKISIPKKIESSNFKDWFIKKFLIMLVKKT